MRQRIESAKRGHGVPIDLNGLSEAENLIQQTQSVLPPIENNEEIEEEEKENKDESNSSDNSDKEKDEQKREVIKVQQFADSRLGFGKSIGMSCGQLNHPKSAVGTFEAVFASMPAPKKTRKAAAKKKKVVVEPVEEEPKQD